MKLHRKFSSVALVNSYYSRSSMVTMVTTAPQVLWEDLDWQKYLEWAHLCSANVVPSPEGHMDSSCSVGWDKDLLVMCAWCGLVSPWCLYRREWWFLAPGVLGKTTCYSLLTSPVVIKFELPKESQKNSCSSKLWLGTLLELLIQRQDLAKIVFIMSEIELQYWHVVVIWDMVLLWL